MKNLLLISALALAAGSCSESLYGKRIKDPFSGSSYESNNRFFRASGKGESSSDNIARSKPHINPKTIFATQHNTTTMKKEAKNYQEQTKNERGADVAEKFQNLARQVMNTDLSDLRKIGEEKFFNDKEKKYTVFVAYEIKKNAMFRFMKKQAKTDKKVDERQMAVIHKILDEQIKNSEE